MRLSRISFSWLLPVVELAFCITILFVPKAIRFWHEPQLTFLPSKIIYLYVDPSAIKREVAPPQPRWVPHFILSGAARQSDAISALNLPGGLIAGIVAVIVEATKSSPNSVQPHPSFEMWRALVLPLCCLPAWWLVGLGLDALLRKRRLHWGLLLTGSILFFLVCTVVVCLYFARPEMDDDVLWMWWGVRFWTIAFAVLPIAWITQSIRHRRPNDTIL